jgi:hypothetical protein
MTEYACPMIEYNRVKNEGKIVLELYCERFNYGNVPDLGCHMETKGDLLYCSIRTSDSFIGRLSELKPDKIEDVMRILEDEFITSEP